MTSFDFASATSNSSPVVIARGMESPVTQSQVLAIWKARRARSDHFPAGLFADPAWDILLSLYATELGGQRSSVGDVVRGSNVPEATALRWIENLLKAGLCAKTPDPTDRRRQFISLTRDGRLSLDKYFQAFQRPPNHELVMRAA